jgi:hypothetical protein
MRHVGLALLFVAIGCSEVRAEFLEGLQDPTEQSEFDVSVLKSQEIDQGQIEPDNEHRRRRKIFALANIVP